MPSSDRRIAANRANALKSTGPKTAEGKEISRANAVTHGLSCLVVVPGEEAGLVAARIEELQASQAPEGDPLSLLLARQVAYLAVQGERAFRYLTAMAADRARAAEADHDEARRTAADELFHYIGSAPLTNHRRLLATAEGCDLLIGRLVELGRVGAPGGAAWEDTHATWFDLCTGRQPGASPVSRAQALSDVIVRDRATGLDATEVPATDRAGRVAWAQGELHLLIAAEVDRLRAHRATLDPDRHAVGRSQAPDRAILSFDKDSQLAHRYQFAAVRLMQRTADKLTARRRELARAVGPAELAGARVEAAVEADLPPMPSGLASFCAALDDPAPPADASTFTIGKPAPGPGRPQSPPRRTP